MNKFWVVAIVSAAMAVPGFMPAQTASRPETQLEAANKKALVSGDLEAAIRQYRDIVAKYPNNRPVAAEALLRMAQCYEKQGAAKAQEAHKAYDRIVREYADQKAAAAEAQRHLTAPLAQIEDRLNVRTVPVAQDNRTYPNSISRDGNSLVFIKADGLYVHNVARNEERRIVTREGAGVQYSSPDISGDGKLVTYARTSKSNGELCVVAADGTNSRLVLKTKEQIIVAKISRDGKQIAYVAGSQGDLQELRIVGTDGSKPRLVFDGKTGSDKPEAFGTSEWSPDGSHFLAWYGVGSQGGHLVLVETASGESKIIATGIGNAHFSPDGHYIAYCRSTNANSAAIGGLFLISTEGGSEDQLYRGVLEMSHPMWTPDGKKILFFARRPDQFRVTFSGLADLYSIQVAEGRAQSIPDLVQRDVERGRWFGVSQTGEHYFQENRARGDLYTLEMDPKTARPVSQPKRTTPRPSCWSPAWSPDGEYLAYFATAVKSQQLNALVVRSLKSGTEREFYPSPMGISDLPWPYGIQWFPDSRSVLLHYEGGEVFRVDVNTGETRRQLGSDIIEHRYYRNGDLLLGPDGRTLYYTSPHDEKRIVRRDLNGGPEQPVCRVNADVIWGYAISPDGAKLVISAASGPWDGRRESIMTVATAGGEPREIYQPKTPTKAIIWSRDGRNLIWSSAQQAAGQKSEILAMPAEGGEPQSYGIAQRNVLVTTISPDGRQIVYHDFYTESVVWIMKLRESKAKSSR